MTLNINHELFLLKNKEYFNKIHKISLLRGGSCTFVMRKKLKEMSLRRNPHLTPQICNVALASVCLCRVEVVFRIDHGYIYLALLCPPAKGGEEGKGPRMKSWSQKERRRAGIWGKASCLLSVSEIPRIRNAVMATLPEAQTKTMRGWKMLSSFCCLSKANVFRP